MKSVVLVHNPSAGKGKYSSQELIDLLAKSGFRARHLDAKNREHLKSLRKLRGGLVVVAGGDGTVGKVSRRVAGNGVTIAVLPLGTANNIARSLGIQGEVPDLIAGLKRAKRKPIDVGIAKGPWGERVFLEGIGAGLFADVMAAIDSGRRSRRKRPAGDENHKIKFAPDDKHLEAALQALAEALPQAKPKATHVAIDRKAINGNFLLVEVMNMPFFGPNLHLTPDADPGDGKFDVVLLGEDHREEFKGYLQHRLEGGKDAPVLTAVRAKRVAFEWRGAKLHIDDKSVAMHDAESGNGKSNSVKIKIERGALHFLLPAPRRVAAAAVPAAKPTRGRNKL